MSRGFHMRGLTLLQDGVPINLAYVNGDFQELEPTFFDHLEVYRGANALRFGSGTLGGAINGVTPTGKTASGGSSYEPMREASIPIAVWSPTASKVVQAMRGRL